MDQQIETFESKIRSAFKKVKQDITFIKGYLKRQDDLLKSVKKELSDTVSSNDFYKFTEKLSDKLEGLRSYYVSKEEYLKAHDKLEKEISQLKTLLESASVKGLSSEMQALRKDHERLKKDGVSKKDYEKLLDDAEHNFKELAKEVAEAKSYETDIQSLQSDVAVLMKSIQEKDKPEKKTKTQEKQELKFQTLIEDTAAKSDGLEKEVNDLRATISELNSEISELKKDSSKKTQDTGLQKEMSKEIEAQRKEMTSSLDAQSRQIQKLSSEMQLKLDESQFLARIEDEVQAMIEKSDLIKVDELNQKIDEFNLALEDLASQKEMQKLVSGFEKESFNPLKKELNQLTKDQEALRKIVTRMEESADSNSAKKLSAIDLRLDRIEEAMDSPKTDSKGIIELQSLVKDLEEEQKMLISEISDISSKPTMNEKIIQSLSKDFEELKERIEDIDLIIPRGKKGKDNDLELLRSEIEFLRNNFVTQGDIDSTLNAISDELRDLKSKSKDTPEEDKLSNELSSVQSDVSQIKKHLSSKVVLLEAESDKYAGQIALLYEDMRKSLERQAFLEKRLSDIESTNDELSAKERDARISYESARDQLESTEKKLQQIETDSERKAKAQLTIQESAEEKRSEGPGLFSRMWTGIIDFFSKDEDEEEFEDEKNIQEPKDITSETKDDSTRSDEKESIRSLKGSDEGFKFFNDEDAEESKKKGRGRPKKSQKDEDDDLY